MLTGHDLLKLEANSADQLTHTIESGSLLLQDKKISSSKLVATPRPNRNSRLVGFERGRRPLQPFVGPKEF